MSDLKAIERAIRQMLTLCEQVAMCIGTNDLELHAGVRSVRESIDRISEIIAAMQLPAIHWGDLVCTSKGRFGVVIAIARNSVMALVAVARTNRSGTESLNEHIHRNELTVIASYGEKTSEAAK